MTDFEGMFRIPMGIPLNLPGRELILAAPLVLALARWMVVLQIARHTGPIPELGFYFKKPVGANLPMEFHDQVNRLNKLEL